MTIGLFSPVVIRKSRAAALEKVTEILEKGDIDAQFADRNGDYYSKDKFLVVWSGNHQGMAAEFSLCKTDSVYKGMTGYAAIYTTQGLFHQHQFKGWPSIEAALIETGIGLCPTRKAKQAFWQRFAKPYNDRLVERRAAAQKEKELAHA